MFVKTFFSCVALEIHFFLLNIHYPTHFKIHVLVSIIGFEKLVNKMIKLDKEILCTGSQHMYLLYISPMVSPWAGVGER